MLWAGNMRSKSEDNYIYRGMNAEGKLYAHIPQEFMLSILLMHIQSLGVG